MTEALTEEELRFLLDVTELARSGATEPLADLLDRGVPVNLTTAGGDSLLMLAAYHAHEPTVRMLLERGADTERVNDRGQTALGAAVFRRSVPIVAELIRAGADPDGGRRTAREIAAFFDLSEMSALMT